MFFFQNEGRGEVVRKDVEGKQLILHIILYNKSILQHTIKYNIYKIQYYNVAVQSSKIKENLLTTKQNILNTQGKVSLIQ